MRWTAFARCVRPDQAIPTVGTRSGSGASGSTTAAATRRSELMAAHTVSSSSSALAASTVTSTGRWLVASTWRFVDRYRRRQQATPDRQIVGAHGAHEGPPGIQDASTGSSHENGARRSSGDNGDAWRAQRWVRLELDALNRLGWPHLRKVGGDLVNLVAVADHAPVGPDRHCSIVTERVMPAGRAWPGIQRLAVANQRPLPTSGAATGHEVGDTDFRGSRPRDDQATAGVVVARQFFHQRRTHDPILPGPGAHQVGGAHGQRELMEGAWPRR
jgi:hypothetical protein